MIIAVVSMKGGVGKTTTAVHLAAYFQNYASTILLDADDTRSAIDWNDTEQGLPFHVGSIDEAAQAIPEYTHTVIDTAQRPSLDDLKAAYAVCDLIVVPAVPSKLDTNGLGLTITALRQVGPDKFKVLLTKVAPNASKKAARLRELLAGLEVPVFNAEIPRLAVFEKAADEGTTVEHMKADKYAARAWEAYTAVGEELTR